MSSIQARPRLGLGDRTLWLHPAAFYAQLPCSLTTLPYAGEKVVEMCQTCPQRTAHTYTHKRIHMCTLMCDTCACIQSQVYTCNTQTCTHTHESPLMLHAYNMDANMHVLSTKHTHAHIQHAQCGTHFHMKPALAYTFRPWDCIGAMGSCRPNSTMSASCCVYTLRLR